MAPPSPATVPASPGTSASSAQPMSTGPRERSLKSRSSVSPTTTNSKPLAALIVSTAAASTSAWSRGAPCGLTSISMGASQGQVTGRPELVVIMNE